MSDDVVFKQPKHDANSDKARLLDHEDPDDTDGYGTFLSSVPKNQERPMSPPLPSNVAVKVSATFGIILCKFLGGTVLYPKSKFSMFFAISQNYQYIFKKWFKHPEADCLRNSNMALKL